MDRRNFIGLPHCGQVGASSISLDIGSYSRNRAPVALIYLNSIAASAVNSPIQFATPASAQNIRRRFPCPASGAATGRCCGKKTSSASASSGESFPFQSRRLATFSRACARQHQFQGRTTKVFFKRKSEPALDPVATFRSTPISAAPIVEGSLQPRDFLAAKKFHSRLASPVEPFASGNFSSPSFTLAHSSQSAANFSQAPLSRGLAQVSASSRQRSERRATRRGNTAEFSIPQTDGH
jgi:hypothetical protein